MNGYIWVVTLCMSFTCIQALSCSRESRCKVSRIRSMKAVDCFNKDMTTFSQCLPKDVEIVDLSHNRIRKLAKEDLTKYPDLKMLYLNDNMIAVIDKETFEEKDYLHTLDLSLNAIGKLPTVLFHLPSLRSLYLGQNLNMNIADVVEKTKPITSPLLHLDISYIMFEEANELPNFGLLSTLEKYNISGNKLISITTKHFAGICSLKSLDTNNVSLEIEDDRCECWKVNRWLKIRKVNFKPFICSVYEADCPNLDVPPDDLELHAECMKEIGERLKKLKMKTILIIVIPIISLLLFSILIYWFLRRRRQRQRKQIKEDSGEEVMLNNVVKK